MSMDTLTDVLRALRLTGAVFLDAEFTAPWCIRAQVEPGDCSGFTPVPARLIAYHYVLEGSLRLSVAGSPPVIAGPGHLLVLPRNDVHLLGSDLDLVPVEVAALIEPGGAQGLARLQVGGGGQRCRVLCGFLGGDGCVDPLVASLPPVVSVAVDANISGAWIEGSIRYAAQALAAGGPGAASSLARLAELLFGEAVRAYLATLPQQQGGWLAGLRDPFVGRALALIHQDPTRAWTLDALSRGAGLSRSALAQRFSACTGVPPMRYLASCRLQRAAQRLRESAVPVGRVAFDIGYASEAAFTRAFKREFGMAPAMFRKT
jgi:AraC-like DNA-binding protein